MEVIHPKKMKKIAQLYGGTNDLLNANIASKVHLHNYAASCKNERNKHTIHSGNQ